MTKNNNLKIDILKHLSKHLSFSLRNYSLPEFWQLHGVPFKGFEAMEAVRGYSRIMKVVEANRLDLLQDEQGNIDLDKFKAVLEGSIFISDCYPGFGNSDTLKE